MAIGVVDLRRRRLVWIPRDVWCDTLRDRINRAFAMGGHQALMDGLAHIGFPVDQSLCLRRRATEEALEGVRVHVRVKKRLQFWYPLSPTTPIEDGRKPIDFVPPLEILSGERFSGIGARYARDRAPPPTSSVSVVSKSCCALCSRCASRSPAWCRTGRSFQCRASAH